jgi:hypothetical protein
MVDGTFEQSTILRTGPDGLTRVITRTSWAERESVLVEVCDQDLEGMVPKRKRSAYTTHRRRWRSGRKSRTGTTARPAIVTSSSSGRDHRRHGGDAASVKRPGRALSPRRSKRGPSYLRTA